jgi:hypothetical protein
VVTITARFRVPGLHYWPGATEGREYLSQPHRHLFHVAVTMRVNHLDRQVEWHDLGTAANELAVKMGDAHNGLIDYGPRSCESLATELMNALRGNGFNVTQVEWSEDGEYTATVTW